MNTGEARLSEVEYVKDDGIIRKKYGAVSLKDHCENVISLDWGSSNFLATGSSMGSMCIYTWKAYELPVQNEETPAPSMGQFDILYYRWSNINSIDISGPITCVGWSHAHPPVGENPVISIAGNDGFVIAWEIIDGEVIPEPTRNYVKEKNYFIPGYSDSPPGCVHDFDVESISSISVSGSSDDLGDDPSEQSDVEEPTYGNQKSDPTSAASDVKGDKDLTDEEMSEEEQEDDTPFEEKLMLKLNQLNEKAEECKAELSDVDTKLSNIFNKQDTLQYWLDHGMLAMQANFEGVQEGVTRYQRSKMIHTKKIEQIEKELLGFKLKYEEMADRHRRVAEEVLSAVRNCHQKQNDIEESIVMKHNHLEENVSRKQDQLHSEHQLKLNQIEKRIGNVNEVCDKILSRLDS